MEPNKLENQIKEKLNSREIQPSAQAWDRLDAMLSVAEEKKTRRPFGFLFIAASITVLLTVGMYFFTQNGAEIQPKDDVVTTEPKDTVQKPASEMPTPIVEQKQVVVSTETQNPESQTTNNNQRVSINNQKPAIKNQQSTYQNPLINRDKEIEYLINSSDVAIKDLPKIRTGSQVIIGGNKEVKSDEALLADLDNLAKQSTNKKATIKVDAKSLLSQVDGELELTFREKVINRVAKNYKEVKVALANRNNE
ncbi:hypothetical protein [Flavobacterium sangjuense]|uniref:Uncharacterized protein n=1 Tax=Flavobacterium sangjuense TaxID=2518177 RepID=A0A4P7PQ23_9FLAO|nr:hypothetical protein [Flavobacterium sangjuense]QBZ96739.1 hypothetical protein GS03_00218 [Flavobacterium sangjuense]